MIQKLKSIAVSILTGALMFAPAMVPVAVSAADANIKGGLCAGANLNVAQTECTATDTEGANTAITNIITKVINIFSIVVGIVAVIMIIIGGLKYITSGGDSGNVTGAKNTILYAIIGLVVVALAQFIVKFVLGNTANITN